MPEEAPGAFGIDGLTREVKDLRRSVDHLAASQKPALAVLGGRLTERLRKSEEKLMATLDSLKDALDAQGQTIQQEAQEVKSQLDQLQATIDELKQNTNDPAKVEELANEIQANTDAIQGIFSGQAPPPTGRRK